MNKHNGLNIFADNNASMHDRISVLWYNDQPNNTYDIHKYAFRIHSEPQLCHIEPEIN